MPETTINEDRNLPIAKHKVRLSEYRLMSAPSDYVVSTKKGDHGKFCVPVAGTADTGHYL